MLRWMGLGGAAALAGCTGDGDGDDGTQGTTADGGDGGGDGGDGGDTTTEEPDRQVGGNYRTAVSSDAESLNWLTIADNTSGAYIDRALDGAWAIDPDQNVFPLWADVSTDDGRVYTIELRDNLQWGADYGQMTADDWVYNITEIFQAEENWTGYPSNDDWFATNPDSGESEPLGIEKTGKLTFDIELFEVDPSFPLRPIMWGQYCMPQKLLEKYAPDKDVEGLKQDTEIQELAYAGNLGPYTYERWDRESQFVVKRNPDYYMHDADVPEAWAGAPYFETSTIKVIKEQSARLGALQRGEIDSAGIPPDKAEKYKENQDIALNVTPQPYISPLVYNMRENGWAPFREKEVRQALAYAVNKQALSDGVYRGYARPGQTMQPEWSKWFNDDEVTNYGVGENYGAELVREKLESALSGTDYGYSGDQLVDGNGEQVTLTIWYDQGQNTEQTTAEFVAQELQQNAGIAVELNATSNFIAKFAANSPPEGTEPEWSAGYFNGGPRDVSTSEEDWDMSVNLGFNTYPRTPADSKVFFEEKGSINYYGYAPENDIAGLYEEAAKSVDEAKRKELFGEAFGLINEEQPFSFLVMESDIIGYRNRVQGYIEDFASGWDFQTWYFRE